MTRGDQRERDRAKNLKKQQDKLKSAGKVSVKVSEIMLISRLQQVLPSPIFVQILCNVAFSKAIL